MKDSIKNIVLYGMQMMSRMAKRNCRLTVEESMKILVAARPNLYRTCIANVMPVNESMDVSIIVPIYNAEKYLKECITSIVSQKTKYTFEVILINDGSTDSSAQILEEFSSDSRVKIIHQENRGFSGARNRGLDEAAGKYFMFVDSDDILLEDAIENMVNKIRETDADIVECGYIEFKENSGNEQICLPEFTGCSSEKKVYIHSKGYFWNKLFKREMFDEIRLPEGVLFEDTLLHMVMLPLCQKMAFLRMPVYKYRLNANGITNTHMINNRSLDTYWVVEAMLKEREKKGLNMDPVDYKFLLWQLCLPTYGRIRGYDEKTRKAVFVLCAEIIEKKQIDCVLNSQQKILEKAFLDRDFTTWELTARLNGRVQGLTIS